MQRRPDDVLRVVHERLHGCAELRRVRDTPARSGRRAATGSASARGGLLACGGQCVASNAAHCGSCDMVCGADQGCSNGSCGSCPAGEIQCTDGACVSPTGGTALHCGGCTPCPAGSTCNGGACTCGQNQMMCGSPDDVRRRHDQRAALRRLQPALQRHLHERRLHGRHRRATEGRRRARRSRRSSGGSGGCRPPSGGTRSRISSSLVVAADAEQPRRRGAVRVLQPRDFEHPCRLPVRALPRDAGHGAAGHHVEDRRRLGRDRPVQRHDGVGADDLRADLHPGVREEGVPTPRRFDRGHEPDGRLRAGRDAGLRHGHQPHDPGGADHAVVRVSNRARAVDVDGRRERQLPGHDAHAVRDRDPARVPVPGLESRRPADGRGRQRQPRDGERSQRADRSAARVAGRPGEPHQHHDRLVQRPADVLEDEGHQPVLGARRRPIRTSRRSRPISTRRRSSS